MADICSSLILLTISLGSLIVGLFGFISSCIELQEIDLVMCPSYHPVYVWFAVFVCHMSLSYAISIATFAYTRGDMPSKRVRLAMLPMTFFAIGWLSYGLYMYLHPQPGWAECQPEVWHIFSLVTVILFSFQIPMTCVYFRTFFVEE